MGVRGHALLVPRLQEQGGLEAVAKTSTQVKVKYSATTSTTGPTSSTSRVSPLGLQTELTKATTDRRAPPQFLASAVKTLKKGEEP